MGKRVWRRKKEMKKKEKRRNKKLKLINASIIFS